MRVNSSAILRAPKLLKSQQRLVKRVPFNPTPVFSKPGPSLEVAREKIRTTTAAYGLIFELMRGDFLADGFGYFVDAKALQDLGVPLTLNDLGRCTTEESARAMRRQNAQTLRAIQDASRQRYHQAFLEMSGSDWQTHAFGIANSRHEFLGVGVVHYRPSEHTGRNDTLGEFLYQQVQRFSIAEISTRLAGHVDFAQEALGGFLRTHLPFAEGIQTGENLGGNHATYILPLKGPFTALKQMPLATEADEEAVYRTFMEIFTPLWHRFSKELRTSKFPDLNHVFSTQSLRFRMTTDSAGMPICDGVVVSQAVASFFAFLASDPQASPEAAFLTLGSVIERRLCRFASSQKDLTLFDLPFVQPGKELIQRFIQTSLAGHTFPGFYSYRDGLEFLCFLPANHFTPKNTRTPLTRLEDQINAVKPLIETFHLTLCRLHKELRDQGHAAHLLTFSVQTAACGYANSRSGHLAGLLFGVRIEPLTADFGTAEAQAHDSAMSQALMASMLLFSAEHRAEGLPPFLTHE